MKSSVRAFVWGFAGVLLAVVFSLGAFAIAEPDLDPSGRGLVPLELDRSPGDDTRPSRSPDDSHSSASPGARPSGSGSDDDEGTRSPEPDDHGGGSDDGGSDDDGSGSSGGDGTDDHDGSGDHDDD